MGNAECWVSGTKWITLLADNSPADYSSPIVHSLWMNGQADDRIICDRLNSFKRRCDTLAVQLNEPTNHKPQRCCHLF